MEAPPEYPIPPQETTARIDDPKDVKLTVRALERAVAEGNESVRDLAGRAAVSLEGKGETSGLTLNLDEAMIATAALSSYPQERFRFRSAERRADLVKKVANMALEDIKASAQALKEDGLLRPHL